MDTTSEEEILKERINEVKESVTLINNFLEASKESMASILLEDEKMNQRVRKCHKASTDASNKASALKEAIHKSSLIREELHTTKDPGSIREKISAVVRQCNELYREFTLEYEQCKALCYEIAKECKGNEKTSKLKKIGSGLTTFAAGTTTVAAAGIAAIAGIFTFGLVTVVGVVFATATVGATAIALSAIAGIFTFGLVTVVGVVFATATVGATVGATAARATSATTYMYEDYISFQEAEAKFNKMYTDMNELDRVIQTLGENISTLYKNVDLRIVGPQVSFFEKSITIHITLSGVSLDRLEDMGISISIPEGSVSKHTDLTIRPCFSGPFQLPPNYESASPVYLISPSRKIDFLSKDVTVRIHHYVCLQSEDDCEDMAFFSASSTPQYTKEKHPVYTFKKICGAKVKFSKKKQFGEISLRHFCYIQTGRKRSVAEDQRLYCANMYKSVQCRDNVSAIFCMCLYSPLYTTHCNEKFSEVYGKREEFKSEMVAKIIGDQVTANAIWTAGQIDFDVTPPIILKRDVDLPDMMGFTNIDMYPPKLIIYVEPSSIKPKIQIIGLDRECTYTNLPIPSPPPSIIRHRPVVHFAWAGVDDSDLADLDVNESLESVLGTVRPLASKWTTLFTELHIDQDTLDVIAHDHPGDARVCLRVGLMKWLRLNYEYGIHGRPSWRMLATAVSSMDNRLSEKIAKDHPKIIPPLVH